MAGFAYPFLTGALGSYTYTSAFSGNAPSHSASVPCVAACESTTRPNVQSATPRHQSHRVANTQVVQAATSFVVSRSGTLSHPGVGGGGEPGSDQSLHRLSNSTNRTKPADSTAATDIPSVFVSGTMGNDVQQRLPEHNREAPQTTFDDETLQAGGFESLTVPTDQDFDGDDSGHMASDEDGPEFGGADSYMATQSPTSVPGSESLARAKHSQAAPWKFVSLGAGIRRSSQATRHSSRRIGPFQPADSRPIENSGIVMPTKSSKKIFKGMKDLLWSNLPSSAAKLPPVPPQRPQRSQTQSTSRPYVVDTDATVTIPRSGADDTPVATNGARVLTCSRFLHMEALTPNPTNRLSANPPLFVTVDMANSLTTLRRLRYSELAPVLPPEALSGPATVFQESHGIYVRQFHSGMPSNKTRSGLMQVNSSFVHDLLAVPHSVINLAGSHDGGAPETNDADTSSSWSVEGCGEPPSGVPEGASPRPSVSRSTIPVQVSVARGFVVVRGNTIERYTRQGALVRRVTTQDHRVSAVAAAEILGIGKVLMLLSANSEFLIMKLDRLELICDLPLDSLDLAWTAYTSHHARRPPPAAAGRVPTCFVCPSSLGYRTGPVLVGSTTGLVQCWKLPDMACEVLLPPPTPLGADMPAVGILWQRFSAPVVPEYDDVASPWALLAERRPRSSPRINKMFTFAWVLYGDGRGALWQVDPTFPFAGCVHCHTLRGVEGMPPLQALPVGDVRGSWSGYFPAIDEGVIHLHEGFRIKSIFDWTRVVIRRRHLSAPLIDELEFETALSEFSDLPVALIVARTKHTQLPGILVLTPRSAEDPVVDFVPFCELGLKLDGCPSLEDAIGAVRNSDPIASANMKPFASHEDGETNMNAGVEFLGVTGTSNSPTENSPSPNRDTSSQHDTNGGIEDSPRPMLSRILEVDNQRPLEVDDKSSVFPVIDSGRIRVCAAKINLDFGQSRLTRKANCLILEYRGIIHVIQIEVQEVGDLQRTTCVPLAIHLTECQEPLVSLRYEEHYDDLFLGLQSGSILVISKLSQQISRHHSRPQKTG